MGPPKAAMLVLLSHIIATLFLASVNLGAAPPDGKPGFERKEEKGQTPNFAFPPLKTLFSDEFRGPKRTLPDQFLKQYKLLAPGGFEIGENGLILKPSGNQDLLIVRPVPPAGSVAGLAIEWDWPEVPEGTTMETRIAFVLSNRQLPRVHFVRKRDTQGVRSWIRFSLGEGPQNRELREYPLPGDLPNKRYVLFYHHGLLELTADQEVLGLAYANTNPNTAKVIGVALEQRRDTTVTVTSLSLAGGDVAVGTEGDENLVPAASEVTQKAFDAFQAGRLDEALRGAAESLALWKKARGPWSPDAANAADNLAEVAQKHKDLLGASNAFEALVEIRTKSLGPGHPLTALARFKWAAVLTELKKKKEAREQLTIALPMLEAVFGKEHATPTAARQMLPLLKD